MFHIASLEYKKGKQVTILIFILKDLTGKFVLLVEIILSSLKYELVIRERDRFTSLLRTMAEIYTVADFLSFWILLYKEPQTRFTIVESTIDCVLQEELEMLLYEESVVIWGTLK